MILHNSNLEYICECSRKMMQKFSNISRSFGNYAYSIVLNDTLKCTINGRMKSWRTKLFFTTISRGLGPFTVLRP